MFKMLLLGSALALGLGCGADRQDTTSTVIAEQSELDGKADATSRSEKKKTCRECSGRTGGCRWVSSGWKFCRHDSQREECELDEPCEDPTTGSTGGGSTDGGRGRGGRGRGR